MQFPKISHLAFACVVAASGGQALAIDSARDAPAVMTFASDERAFINKAAQSAKYEVDASRLAASKSGSPRVKQFAQNLIRDHASATAGLKVLTDEKQYAINDELTKSQASKIDQLRRSSGSAFDASYREWIGVDAHTVDVKSFTAASKSARDEKLKAWAANTLPVLERHLAEAQTLR